MNINSKRDLSTNFDDFNDVSPKLKKNRKLNTCEKFPISVDDIIEKNKILQK